MQALYDSILDLMSKIVIPDWGELVGLLPLGLAGLTVLWFAWTIRKYATAGPTRRAPARLAPVAPPGVHMPGGSYAPILGAVGAAALLAGLVIGGSAVLVGLLILSLGLLYWGREAIREFDHATEVQTLPAVVHAGPPPGVHMPGPSFRPILGAIGAASLLGGLVVGGWVLAAGVIVLAATLVGWLVDARAEYVRTVEADRTGHLENIPAPGWPRGLLQGAVILVVLAALVQAGIIPPRPAETAGGPGPGGSPAPGASEEPAATEWTVVAKDISYDRHAISVPANAPFTITFENEDAPGISHDVDIRQADKKTVVQDQAVTNGGATSTYGYDGLPPGDYVFICSIHPVPPMTGTVTVK